MSDLGGLDNMDLNSLITDLRSYLKCLVQDYCKKNANFIVRPMKMEAAPMMMAAPTNSSTMMGAPTNSMMMVPPPAPRIVMSGLNAPPASSIYVNMQAGSLIIRGF
jgi:hypothetical protein